MMEVSRPDVIDMPLEDELTPFLFIVPNSDVSGVSASYEERQMRMKITTSNRSFPFLQIL